MFVRCRPRRHAPAQQASGCPIAFALGRGVDQDAVDMDFEPGRGCRLFLMGRGGGGSTLGANMECRRDRTCGRRSRPAVTAVTAPCRHHGIPSGSASTPLVFESKRLVLGTSDFSCSPTFFTFLHCALHVSRTQNHEIPPIFLLLASQVSRGKSGKVGLRVDLYGFAPDLSPAMPTRHCDKT